MENAAIRENFTSEIYCSGAAEAKERILKRLPKDIAQLHRSGDLHIHDLESFGKLYNCCTPDLCGYLLSRRYISRSGCGKIMEVFEAIKLLVTSLATVQSGGIGFGNLDADLEQVFETLALEKTETNVEFLTEAAASFICWVNETRTRYCRETYYLTVNLGLATGFWGRAVTSALLQSFMALPKSCTKPNFVFKVCGGVNSQPGTVNYDLYQLALRCTASRMVPTYLLMDSAVNRVCDPARLNIMGCRTRVYDNVAGEAGTVGRGNIAYTSINLPRIALSCPDERGFERRLRQLMETACQLVEIRNDWITETGGKYIEFVLRERLWRGTSSLEDLLRQGTYAVGFIGLSETVELLTGEKMYQTQRGKGLAEDIVKAMNDFVMEQRRRTGMNFSLLATPGEMISGRFCQLDRERFPNPVQEKGFYTNSFHVDVDADLPIFEKLAFEAPFHGFCNGGSISYVEFSSALFENSRAIEDVLSFAQAQGVSYLGINFPLDVCKKCQTSGTFDICPSCGSREIARIRRVSGYLEEEAFFTDGKKAEVIRRRANGWQ